MIDPALACTLPETWTVPTIRCTVEEAEGYVRVPESKWVELKRMIGDRTTMAAVEIWQWMNEVRKPT